jgi:hypothetical protein
MRFRLCWRSERAAKNPAFALVDRMERAERMPGLDAFEQKR